MTGGVFHIGNGAGFAVDHAEAGGPVVDALIASGKPAAMFYEMLSERTLALAQRDLLAHPDRGYAPYMVEFLAPVLRKCRSEEHTSELQSLMRISYAVFCLKKKT